MISRMMIYLRMTYIPYPINCGDLRRFNTDDDNHHDSVCNDTVDVCRTLPCGWFSGTRGTTAGHFPVDH